MFQWFKKSPAPESAAPKRFFSVSIGEKLVQAALWETNQNVKVLAKSEAKPYFNTNDLLVKLDGALQELGAESEVVHQTLFHLDSSFVTGAEIATDKKDLFHQVTEALQLESLGFVTNTEAAVNAKLALNPDLQQQLVVEFTSDHVVYSLYSQKTLLDVFEDAASEDFPTQFKGALVQLASHLGADYAPYFRPATDQLSAAPAVVPPLFVNFISALITSEEIQTKLTSLPPDLPLKAEILGSDILLSFILIPSATIIAKSYGWLQEVPDAAPVPASTPPATPVSVAAPLPKLSRQKNAPPPTVAATEFATPTPPPPAKTLSKAAKRNMIITIIIIVLLTAVSATTWFVISQITATIQVTPKQTMLVKNLEVIIDPTASASDYENSILPGKIVNKEIEHVTRVPTTGKKQVGEVAKGRVEIQNKKTQSRTLTKGTQLEYGEYVFVFDEEIVVPAAEKTQTDDGENTKFGKAEVNVTATTPGAGGNLPKDSSLRVGTWVKDEIEAKIITAFTGGTDKTVAIFTTEDEKKAISSISDELKQIALTQIDSQAGDTYQAVQADKLKVTGQKFNAKIGDEVSEVEMTVTATVPVITYQLNELEPLAQVTLDKELPAGYVFVAGSKPTYMSAVNESKTAASSNGIYLDVDLSQAIATSLDATAIHQQLAGQPLTKAENLLKNMSEIKTHDLKWSQPTLAKILSSLPTGSQLIIEVSSND
jgi:hypothetical protein